MNKIIMFEKINKILSQWDPIGVGFTISDDEYMGYVPRIMKCIDNEISLRSKILSLLNELELEYQPENKRHKQETNNVIKLLTALNKS